MAHPGGRPPIYCEEMLTKAREYLSSCHDKESTILPGKIEVNIPSIGGLAVALKINRDTIYEWLKDKEKQEFSDIIAELQAEQERRLINNGLAGTYNSTIAKVLLAKQGYRDAVDTDVTSKGEQITGINYVIPDNNTT